MIQLDNELLNSRDFVASLQKLKNAQGLDVKTMYTVSKILAKIETWIKQGRDIYAKMVKEHASVDGSGALVPEKTPDGQEIPGSFTIAPEKKDSFESSVKEFLAATFEVKSEKLNPLMFERAGLTPNDLTALKSLFNFDSFEVEEGA